MFWQKQLLSLVTLAVVVSTSQASPHSHSNHWSLFKRQHHARQQAPTGFQLIPEWFLEDSDLNPTCQGVLKQQIACDDEVMGLGDPVYHGSLEDPELTEAVCSASCKNSLTAAERRISGACASTPEYIPGRSAVSLAASLLSGWNETCLRDEESGEFCNDLIASWGDYEELTDMPEEQLCSFCFGGKLRMMQASPYSGYDELFQDQLEFVNKECGIEGPTEVLPPLNSINVTEPVSCASGNMYEARDGDTCDSIALSESLSAATLYFINPNLLNCSSIDTGTELCLPEVCTTTHIVQEGDSCVALGISAGTSWMRLIDWNLALDARCSNIWSEDPFWGRILCLSPPGGSFEDGGPGDEAPLPGDGNNGGPGGSGDGYADKIVEIPEGVVAEGTTVKCGEWVRAEDGVGCSSMLLGDFAVPINLFIDANPSLESPLACDSNLVGGVWYCLRPFRYWSPDNAPR